MIISPFPTLDGQITLHPIQSSSFLGPLIVGVIADTTGNIRYAFFFLLFMLLLALPVLLCVNVDKGREDAKMYVYNVKRLPECGPDLEEEEV